MQGALEGFFFSLENQAYEEPPVTSTTIPVETTSSTDANTTSTEATTTSGSEAGSTTTDTAGETTTTVPETTTSTTTTLPRVPIEDQVAQLTDQSPAFGDAIPVFVSLYNLNLDRVEQGESGFWTELKQKVSDIANEKLSDGIRSTDLVDVRNGLIQSPPSIFVIGLDTEQRTQLQKAAAILVAGVLQANEKIDDAATIEARQAASDAVQEKNAQFFQGQQIAAEGDILTQVQIDAINKLGLIEPAKGTSRKAIVLLGALTVGLTAFFLWRLSPGRWSEPKHFALLGILVVLAALASRVPELVDGTDGSFAALGFAVPAMLFGYVAAILYDPRTAVILAIPVTTFVGISTADPAITVFAAGATVAPVAFVSSVSSRRRAAGRGSHVGHGARPARFRHLVVVPWVGDSVGGGILCAHWWCRRRLDCTKPRVVLRKPLPDDNNAHPVGPRRQEPPGLASHRGQGARVLSTTPSWSGPWQARLPAPSVQTRCWPKRRRSITIWARSRTPSTSSRTSSRSPIRTTISIRSIRAGSSGPMSPMGSVWRVNTGSHQRSQKASAVTTAPA